MCTANDALPNDTEQVGVRRLTVEDAATVADLEQEVFGKEAWPQAIVAEELAGEWGFYVGAEAEGKLVGYAGLKGASEVDVMTVGVVPEWRGRGLGRRLVEELVREAGPRPLFLEVRESNAAALGLYESLGFERIGRVKRYYRDPVEDAITMRRRGTGRSAGSATLGFQNPGVC